MSIERAEPTYVVPMPIAQSEGETIRRMVGKLPSLTVQMDYGYARGTHLKLEMEVRVRSYTVDEIKSGADKGELVREHNFAIEEVKIIGAYTAEQMEQGVGGSASAAAVMKEEASERREGHDAEGARPGGDGGEEPWDPDF